MPNAGVTRGGFAHAKPPFRLCSMLAAGAIVAGCNSTSVATIPPPTRPAIGHIVIMLQENRSFNNLFMGFPGADTATTGKCKAAPKVTWCPSSGVLPIKRVTLQERGIVGGMDDIDHSHHAFEVECDPDRSNVCRMDGFDLIRYGEAGSFGVAKTYPYRAVDRAQTKPYWDLASQYTLADHMFFTETAASFIAHQEIIAGTVRYSADASLTDQPSTQPWGCDAAPGVYTPLLYRDGHETRYSGPFPCFTQYKTMPDVLDPAHVTWKFYVDYMAGNQEDFSGSVWNGFDAIKRIRYGHDWANISRPNASIFRDLRNGTLPQVSWLIPSLCASDHPASGANQGPKWVTQVVNAIGTSKYWRDTAIVLLWDDWGGWYDNVPPAQTNYTSLGFRVPMIVISPYAKPGYVAHTQYDFGSVLKFVEQTFNTGSLDTTDATAASMQDIFDFSQRPNVFKPAPIPHVSACPVEGLTTQQVIDADGGPPG